jgi:hypothetical protein
MSHRYIIIFGFALTLLSTSVLSGQELATSISTDSVLVGERFHATISVDVDAGYVVGFPDLTDAPFTSGDVEFIRVVEIASAPDVSTPHTDHATFEIATFAIDSALVGGLPVRIVSPYGDTLVAAAPYVVVGVYSIVPGDTQGLQGLAPLATFPALIWPWVLGGLVLIAAGAAAYHFWKRRRDQRVGVRDDKPSVVDPYDNAVNRLRQLAEQEPSTDEEIRQYYIELSDTLRSYLEYTIHVPALERTSSELMQALKRLAGVSIDLLGEETIGLIGRSLNVSDLAKFASYRPPNSENTEMLELTRRSIDSIEKARRRRLVAESETAEANA